MSGHLKRLCDIGYFTCPQVSELRPYSIPDRMEIIEILTGGKLRFEVNGEERIFGRGTVFWHMAGDKTICRTFIDDPYRCIVFRFIVGENRRPGPRVSCWQNPEETMTFCEECHRAFHSGGVDLDALGEYAYAMIRWKSQSHGAVPTQNTPKALRDVCAYIERHLGEELSLDRMAARCGISRPHLFALFRKHLGKAPLHYIQERRIIQAKIQLTAPENRSIKEIAMNCGFPHLEVFYRQFKIQSGLTPADYRRKYSAGYLQENQDV